MKSLLAPLFCALLIATTAQSFARLVNMNRPGLALPMTSKLVKRDDLVLPDAKGPRLPDKQRPATPA